jgi:hypothetical protein
LGAAERGRGACDRATRACRGGGGGANAGHHASGGASGKAAGARLEARPR